MSLSDYTLSLINPVIYRNSSSEAENAAILTQVFDRFGRKYTLADPDANLDFSSLDNFLGGRDAILIGGPIENASSAIFQTYFQNTLSGITNLSFTGGTDGTAFQSEAPQITITNTNGTFIYPRIKLNPIAMRDYAIIARVSGTSNTLFYIAGIRDSGTALALFVLDWVTKDSALWPPEFNEVSILTNWKTSLANSNCVLLSFILPIYVNTFSLADFISQYLLVTDDTNLVIQDIASIQSTAPQINISASNQPHFIGPPYYVGPKEEFSFQFTVTNIGADGSSNPDLHVIDLDIFFTPGVNPQIFEVIATDPNNPTFIAAGESGVFNFTIKVHTPEEVGNNLLLLSGFYNCNVNFNYNLGSGALNRSFFQEFYFSAGTGQGDFIAPQVILINSVGSVTQAIPGQTVSINYIVKNLTGHALLHPIFTIGLLFDIPGTPGSPGYDYMVSEQQIAELDNLTYSVSFDVMVPEDAIFTTVSILWSMQATLPGNSVSKTVGTSSFFGFEVTPPQLEVYGMNMSLNPVEGVETDVSIAIKNIFNTDLHNFVFSVANVSDKFAIISENPPGIFTGSSSVTVKAGEFMRTQATIRYYNTTPNQPVNLNFYWGYTAIRADNQVPVTGPIRNVPSFTLNPPMLSVNCQIIPQPYPTDLVARQSDFFVQIQVSESVLLPSNSILQDGLEIRLLASPFGSELITDVTDMFTISDDHNWLLPITFNNPSCTAQIGYKFKNGSTLPILPGSPPTNVWITAIILNPSITLLYNTVDLPYQTVTFTYLDQDVFPFSRAISNTAPVMLDNTLGL